MSRDKFLYLETITQHFIIFYVSREEIERILRKQLFQEYGLKAEYLLFFP